MELDYGLTSTEDRLDCVKKQIATSDHLTNSQLTYMADYLLQTADAKSTKREKAHEYPITTKNREVTVKKRQISFEETAANLQNGEDGIYGLIVNDKNALLDARTPITDEDKANIPGIAENMVVIESLKSQLERAKGKRRFQLKQQIISKYQECYTLKSTYTGVSSKARMNSQMRAMAHIQIPENVWLDENDVICTDGFVSLLRPEHVSFLLNYYQMLKQESYGDFDSDMGYLLWDLEDTVVRALLPDNEILYDLIVWKVDGLTGEEIAAKMLDKYGIDHSEQYYSTLWSKRIPKLVAEQAQKDWLMWHWRFEAPREGKWKFCRTCGQLKPAHSLYFHKNASTDGFYSKCRECRSRKNKYQG